MNKLNIGKVTNTFCLLEGRHQIPGDPPAAVKEFDFSNKKSLFSEQFKYYVEATKNRPRCFFRIYVTGLTPALIDTLNFIKEAKGAKREYTHIYLLHYDRETDSYWKQEIEL